MEMTKDHAGQTTDGGIRLCESCGAKIFADAPTGYCPACLLETGLDLLKDDEAHEANPGQSSATTNCWRKLVAAARELSIARARRV